MESTFSLLFSARSRLTELEDLEYAHLPNVNTSEEGKCSQRDGDSTNHTSVTRRRGLRSDRSIDSNSNGNLPPEGNCIKSSSR